MEISKIYLGDIFYRYIGDEIEMLRVYNVSQKRILLKDKNNSKKQFNFTRENLLKNYSRLMNNAFMTFYIPVFKNGNKDVCVTIHRRKDLENGITEIYAICRQQVADLFNEMLNRDNIYHLGMSLSRDTCPNNVNFDDYTVCDGIEQAVAVSMYIGDTLDDVLSFINKTPYDKVLKDLFNNSDQQYIDGMQESLYQMLWYHNIMDDFYLGNNIVQVPFVVNNNEITPEQLNRLEDYTKHMMSDLVVVKYDFDIDINNIKRSHINIIDAENNIYIIGYTKGDYVNESFKKNIQDKRDAIAMLKYISQAKSKLSSSKK